MPVVSILFRLFAISFTLFTFARTAASAGGPKFIAGTKYFDPAVVGQPVHRTNGQPNYYVDQGPLNSSISDEQAVSMVDSAAAIWSAVPTAGVTLTNKGTLDEDVSEPNTTAAARGRFAQPSDVTPTSTGYPAAIIFDADGSVIDAFYGTGASDPTSCQNNGVLLEIDQINTNATFAHAFILLNGRCATNSQLVDMMSFEIERAFGRILGLDFSQVNREAAKVYEPGGLDGWPVMQPLSGLCSSSGGTCIPNPAVLRYDDIAALNRIYPITAQNLSSFPGKLLTASNTISIRGSISFRTGSGMQGVNVVVRPLDANGNPMYQYTVSAVSDATFSGDRGNRATGYSDANDLPFARWGSNDSSQQGEFDLSGIPLPPGADGFE